MHLGPSNDLADLPRTNPARRMLWPSALVAIVAAALTALVLESTWHPGLKLLLTLLLTFPALLAIALIALLLTTWRSRS